MRWIPATRLRESNGEMDSRLRGNDEERAGMTKKERGNDEERAREWRKSAGMAKERENDDIACWNDDRACGNDIGRVWEWQGKIGETKRNA